MVPEVGTSAGTVRGVWDDGVAAFRGILLAAPPVGPNRFAAPRPAEPWDGVRDGSRFGSPPPQPGRHVQGGDWLTLAVWTPDPAPSAGLPVVVWISGGAYLNCDSADPHLAGAALAAAGAVVVSGHYRTGVEGFARLEGAPDNRGLLDQIAVLRWVQDNIAGFGGDPANVTVLGQSADMDGEVTAAGPDAVVQAGRLAELMRTEHLAFAATGDPGWPRYRPHDRRTRVYDAESTVGPYPEEPSRRLWRDERFGALGLDLE